MHAPAAQPIDPALLLHAYRQGVFPMADARDDPEVFWVEPKARAILSLDGLRLSRSLRRTLKRDRFTVTCNADFDAVIESCAQSAPGVAPPPRCCQKPPSASSDPDESTA